MLKERDCKLCGEIFTPQTANQQYCCKECKTIAKKKRDREKSKTYKLKKKQTVFRNFPKIPEIVGICEKVREQTGEIVSYGWVSHLSECGKLDTLGVNL